MNNIFELPLDNEAKARINAAYRQRLISYDLNAECFIWRSVEKVKEAENFVNN